MRGMLVDANVIIDILTEDPTWYDWSANTLAMCAESHALYINQVIYSEISISYQRIEELESMLSDCDLKKAIMPWEAAFLAGKAFIKYRQTGGRKILPLPDFFIGAHALVENMQLITRDRKRFEHYFPNLDCLAPQ